MFASSADRQGRVRTQSVTVLMDRSSNDKSRFSSESSQVTTCDTLYVDL